MNLVEEAFASGILLTVLTWGTWKVVWMNIREGILEEKSAKK